MAHNQNNTKKYKKVVVKRERLLASLKKVDFLFGHCLKQGTGPVLGVRPKSAIIVETWPSAKDSRFSKHCTPTVRKESRHHKKRAHI